MTVQQCYIVMYPCLLLFMLVQVIKIEPRIFWIQRHIQPTGSIYIYIYIYARFQASPIMYGVVEAYSSGMLHGICW
jgi:hypothetical protein